MHYEFISCTIFYYFPTKFICFCSLPLEHPVETVDPISYTRINHAIENEVTFEREMMALLNEIQLSDAELMGRYQVICPHLTDIFRSSFPECQIFSFGSTVAGLSFKECDLDIYMYLGTVGKEDLVSLHFRRLCVDDVMSRLDEMTFLSLSLSRCSRSSANI